MLHYGMSTTRNKQVIAERLTLSPCCIRCTATDSLTVHHIVAIADGGEDAVHNTTTLCNGCHCDWHFVFEGNLTWEAFLNSVPSRFLQAAFNALDDDTTIGEVRATYYHGRAANADVALQHKTKARERQREGIERAKGLGAYKGGKARIDAHRVNEMLSRGMNPSDIARTLGISRQSVYRLRDSC